MDLIGSKKRLNAYIFGRIARRFPDGLGGKLFVDACCGSASTSRYAASQDCRVVAKATHRGATIHVCGARPINTVT